MHVPSVSIESLPDRLAIARYCVGTSAHRFTTHPAVCLTRLSVMRHPIVWIWSFFAGNYRMGAMNRMKKWFLLGFVVVVIGACTVAEAEDIIPSGGEEPLREWTDTTGAFQIDATFVSYEDGNVRLRRFDGKITTVPISRLSKPDRDYVRRVTSKVATDKPPKTASRRRVAPQGPGYSKRTTRPDLPDLSRQRACAARAAAVVCTHRREPAAQAFTVGHLPILPLMPGR